MVERLGGVKGLVIVKGESGLDLYYSFPGWGGVGRNPAVTVAVAESKREFVGNNEEIKLKEDKG